MLGPPKARRLDRPVLVSLEGLVPAGHFYRHLDAALDLGFVRDWVAGCYAERGRPSIDPVVFFKLQLIMFFEGIRSERRLMEQANLNLAHRCTPRRMMSALPIGCVRKETHGSQEEPRSGSVAALATG